MTFSKINFTAENNLLGNMYNKVSTQQKETTTVTQPPKEQTAATEPTNKNNKLRNWSIGMGSAATLITLGVLGRKGYLGEGAQKLLGGIKKNASDIADDLKAKGEELLEGGTPKAPEKIEPEIPEAPVKPETQVKPEAPEIPEAPVKPETQVKPEPQVTTQAGVRIEGTLSKAEMDAINAGLDRTIPQIDKQLLTTEIPDFKPLIDELNSIDISKLRDGYNTIPLPNGNNRLIIIAKGKIIQVTDTTPDAKEILSGRYVEGKINTISRDNECFFVNTSTAPYSKKINGISYWYNSDGTLSYLFEDLPNKQIKCTHINNNTSDISHICYYNATYKNIKDEYFIDGKLASEVFYQGNNVTRVTHDLSRFYRDMS